ncbi:DUF106 domain-containing protein [Candidatus Pacearchaeota archaeon]|nr:DUF106 domain-containing protein [Candidatus Pacearchaeota archaeon]
MVVEFIQQFAQSSPRIFVILVSILVSLFISAVNYFVLNKERMREIKERQKALQAEMKKHKDNPQKMMDLQKEMFSHVGESFKHSMKPMLITFIPIVLFFPLIRSALITTEIAKTWFWWYLGTSIVASMAFRKLFKLP